MGLCEIKNDENSTDLKAIDFVAAICMCLSATSLTWYFLHLHATQR